MSRSRFKFAARVACGRHEFKFNNAPQGFKFNDRKAPCQNRLLKFIPQSCSLNFTSQLAWPKFHLKFISRLNRLNLISRRDALNFILQQVGLKFSVVAAA